MRGRFAALFAVALLIAVSTTPVWAQRTTATVEGIVVDSSGGVLPGANVTLTNEGTGLVDRQVTNAGGEFTFNYVPPGTYTVTIAIAGFKTEMAKGISVGASENIRRKFSLQVGALEDAVTVSGEAPLINVKSPEQRISLEATELATLPIANRNLTNLLNIGIGLTKQEAVAEGGGTGGGSAGTVRLRLNGLGGAAMSITANGTEASGNSGSRSISSYNGVSKIDIVSIESIGEVNIVKGIVPAEFGNALAGNLNVITKAGSNIFHGSVFDRYEGARLDSKPFFLKNKPSQTWNQGGGSLGGPLLRDRAFFFAAFEGYRLDKVLELNAQVPTVRMQNLLLTAMPFPETQKVLDQYPAPTEPLSSSTALLGTFIGPGKKKNNDDHVDIRGDFRVKGGNLSSTFTYGHPYLSQESTLPNEPTVFTTKNWRTAASYAIARGRASFETRFGYSYTPFLRVNAGVNLLDPINPGPLSNVYTSNRRLLPNIIFPGLQSFGDEGHGRGQQPSYSAEQQITLVTEEHAFKFGGIYSTPRGGRFNTQASEFSFNTEADLLANRPASISIRPRNIDSRWKSINWGLFVQDDWRLNTKLVVNLGVRYDYFGRVQYRGANPNDPTCCGFINLNGTPDPTFTSFGSRRDANHIIDDDKFNVGPRIGFAYNPDANGHTVINGGWGMMFQGFDPQTFEGLQIGALSGVPSITTFTRADVDRLGLKYPIYNEDMYQFLLTNPIQGATVVGPLFKTNLQAPYAHVFTVGVQRAFGTATVVNAAFLGTRGYHFRMYQTYNLPDRITGLRPNPNLNQNTYYSDNQKTTYDSLQTSIKQRLSKNLQFNLNYTWSSTRSNYDGDNAGPSTNDETQNVQEFFDTVDANGVKNGPSYNWGPALGDVRHNFVGDVSYLTPGAGWSSPLVRQLLGSWQVSTVFRFRTGEPLTVTQAGRSAARPDVIDAAHAINTNCCDIASRNLQYLNLAAFELIPLSPVSTQPIRAGNATVGQFRLPGLRNVDLSLGKLLNIGGQRRIELRADILNAFNWVNYQAVSTNRSASNFGKVTGVFGARVTQLQARFSF